MDIATLIKVKFSGVLDQTVQYTTIGVQTIAVLIGGIVLWKGSDWIFNRKQKKRKERRQFETRFSSHWKHR